MTTLWSEVDYISVGLPSEVRQYVRALESLYTNGKVISHVFDAQSATQFDSAIRDDRQASSVHELRSFLKWLSKQEVGKELNLDAPPQMVTELGGFACEGNLTHLLCTGGAYARLDSELQKARQLSFECMKSLFGEELHHVRAFWTYEYWSRWFNDSGWDVAIFATEYTRRRWWVLCATDID